VKKLTAFNGEYIRALAPEEFIAASTPFLARETWAAAGIDHGFYARIAPLIQTRVATLAETAQMVDFFFLAEPVIDQAAWDKTMSADYARDVLADFADGLGTVEWNHDSLKNLLEAWSSERGLKVGKTQAPIRVALTGRTVGPPLFESIEILGREESIARMRRALQRLG